VAIIGAVANQSTVLLAVSNGQSTADSFLSDPASPPGQAQALQREPIERCQARRLSTGPKRRTLQFRNKRCNFQKARAGEVLYVCCQRIKKGPTGNQIHLPTSVPTKELTMKRKVLTAIAAASVLLTGATMSISQQVVGSTQLGVAVAERRDVTTGWSAKRQVLGKTVFNDSGDGIGKVDDIIVAPDKAVSYAIIGAGGFLGVDRHDVAIPVSQIRQQSDGKFILAGATKDALKAMPPFEYAN
jgi:sporulation protein YlmC with PRC-barrel domain